MLYTIWRHRQLRRAQRLSLPIAVVVPPDRRHPAVPPRRAAGA